MLCVPLLVLLPLLPGRPPRPPPAGPAAGCSCSSVQVADAVAQRRAGRHRRPARAAAERPPAPAAAAHDRHRRWAGSSRRLLVVYARSQLRPRRDRSRTQTQRQRHADAPRSSTSSCRPGARPAPAVRDGLQHLRRLLPVRDRASRTSARTASGSRPWSRPAWSGWPSTSSTSPGLTRVRAGDAAAADPDSPGWARACWPRSPPRLAANFFYLTMSFDYFYAVVLLVVAGAALYAPARAEQRARRPRWCAGHWRRDSPARGRVLVLPRLRSSGRTSGIRCSSRPSPACDRGRSRPPTSCPPSA